MALILKLYEIALRLDMHVNIIKIFNWKFSDDVWNLEGEHIYNFRRRRIRF